MFIDLDIKEAAGVPMSVVDKAIQLLPKKKSLLWRICGWGRGPFVRFNPAGWILLLRLLLRLWACGQRACVVQAKRHVHSPIAQRVVAWWVMRKR